MAHSEFQSFLHEAEEWYSHYRHSAFSQMQVARGFGARTISMIQICPERHNHFTVMEFEALKADARHAYDKKNNPFFSSDGTELLPFGNVVWSQVRLEDLERHLQVMASPECSIIICSCADEQMSDVERIILAHNTFERDQRLANLKVMSGWATCRDVYQTRQSATLPSRATCRDVYQTRQSATLASNEYRLDLHQQAGPPSSHPLSSPTYQRRVVGAEVGDRVKITSCPVLTSEDEGIVLTILADEGRALVLWHVDPLVRLVVQICHLYVVRKAENKHVLINNRYGYSGVRVYRLPKSSTPHFAEIPSFSGGICHCHGDFWCLVSSGDIRGWVASKHMSDEAEAIYLPKKLSGTFVLKEADTAGIWIATKDTLGGSNIAKGLAFRRTKNLEEVVEGSPVLAWGAACAGIDEGDWVRTTLQAIRLRVGDCLKARPGKDYTSDGTDSYQAGDLGRIIHIVEVEGVKHIHIRWERTGVITQKPINCWHTDFTYWTGDTLTGRHIPNH